MDLRHDLQELLELDKLRSLAKDTRDAGMRALAASLKEPDRWETVRGCITPMLIKRVAHKSRTLGLDIDWPDQMKLPTVGFEDRGQEPHISIVKGDMSVFAAATYLRARLDHLDGFIPSEVVLTLYAMIKELYSVDSPDWALGGARAGHGIGATSLLVTLECSRAIGYLATSFERTADLLETLARHHDYVERVIKGQGAGNLPDGGLPLDKDWSDAELKRVREGIITLFLEQEDKVLFGLTEYDLEQPAGRIMNRVKINVRHFLERSHVELKAALSAITKNRKLEEKMGRATKDAGASSKSTSSEGEESRDARIRAMDLSKTAHHHMVSSIEKAMDQLVEDGHRSERKRPSKAASNDAPPQGPDQLERPKAPPFSLDKASRRFRSAARMIRDLLGPVQNHVTSAMHRLIVSGDEEHKVYAAQELAFAASCAGALQQNWHDKLFHRTARILEQTIDQDGQLPIGRPFYVGDNDSERFPVNGHTLRAMAHIYSRSSYRPSLKTVERMVRYFTVHAEGVGKDGIAWMRMSGGAGTKPSPWLSAVNLLALGRIVRMLDERINDQILSHFTYKDYRVQRDGIPLDDLMCSDMGLASMHWSEGEERGMLTQDMERLRRRLVPKRLNDGDQWSSMILYGPPGTGKTTIVASLAQSARVPMLEVTPGDFLLQGAEGLEFRAKTVMTALSLLTRVVVLFDEFDSVILDRTGQTNATSVFSFLTGGMLPKLADLNKAAKRNQFVYVLATNYVDRLDAAAIRQGRFDHKRGVYPPDLASRMCRLVSQLSKWELERGNSGGFTPKWQERAAEVVAKTGGVTTERLVQRGWYTAPKTKDLDLLPRNSAWAYILKDQPIATYPMPADLGSVRDRTHRDAKKQFRNLLEIDEYYENNMVTLQDERAAVRSDGKDPMPWSELTMIAKEDPKALIKERRSEEAGLRKRR